MNIKPHYLILDGLRGAAALMVLWYHVFEGFAFAGGTAIETFNHGHLGVDFFFMLSGFVISYAYDDRWKSQSRNANSLTIGAFFKRRLIRLQPMVVMGALIGLITYLIQGGVRWDGTQMSFHWIMMAFLLAMFLIPAYPGAPYDVRGNGEMYPLNGPSWSLFFEYIGNILYALFIRKLSNKQLTALVVTIGLLWIAFVVFDISGYDMIGIGWTLDAANFLGGLLRMLFPFSLGMLMARNFNKTTRLHDNKTTSFCPCFKLFITKNIFWIAIIVMFVLFSMPYISKTGDISVNGIYELACIIFVFPFIVWFGAAGNITSKFSTKICKFLGDISYPLYIVHYPVMYLFYSWLIDNKLYSLGETWQVVLLVMATNIALAYACLKLYDEPIRKLLNR
ncbi:MAG: acyltransferase [Bacteroidales bacterium]|nr:acyltransferase [Bacteroidales bacterium]